MDGTFYQTENDVIEPSSLSAVKKLKEAGYKVAAATGRPLNMMKQILDQVNFDYYVLINGGYVLDENFNEISTSPIPSEEVRELIDLARDNALGLMFHFGDATYIYNDFYPMYDFSKYTNSLEGLFYDPTQSYHNRHAAYNAVIVTKKPELVSRFVESHPDLRLDLINIKTDGFAFDVFSAGNDKSYGIEQILKNEGLGWEDVMTIGDSTNDLQMISKAGFGVAMGTAKDVVKDAADYVTASVYAGGFAQAVKELLDQE